MKKILILTILFISLFYSLVIAAPTVTLITNACTTGPTCTLTYNVGDTVNLTATPDPGWYFTGWLADYCYGTGTCTFVITTTMPLIIYVNAIFQKNPTVDLYVYVYGRSGSRVTSSPAGIDCIVGTSATTCSSSFPTGTRVTLTGITTTGGNSYQWRGQNCNINRSCPISMVSGKTVNVFFK